MRRKLIAKLMQIEEPIEANALRRLLLDDDSKESAVARTVLAAALQASRQHGVTDPEQIYMDICEATPMRLAETLASTQASAFSQNKIAQAQAILKSELTSKAGRPATGSPITRQAQLAAAQARRREKLANDEGRKQINEWISAAAAERLSHVQQFHGCKSRAEALELILQQDVLAAMLKAPGKS